MKLQPVRDLVLIQAEPVDKKTKGGIYMVENWKTLPLQGDVLEVGPDVTRVKPGDKVVFMRYASTILENDQRLAKENHILAIDNA